MNPFKLTFPDISDRLPSAISDWLPSINTRTVLIGATSFLIVRWLLRPKGPEKRMPPGPRGWPIVGSALSFSGNKQLHITLTEWAKIYGGIYTVRLGRTECVFLCDKDSLRDILIEHGDNSQHRPMHLPLFKKFGGGGITNNIGEDWKYQRRTAISAMRDLGMGKKTMEERIIDEAQYLLQELEKAGNSPIDLKEPLFYASNNIICTIIFGNRFEQDDPEFHKFMNALMILMSSGGIQNVSMFFPELLVLLPFLMRFAMKTIKQVQNIRSMIKVKIDNHRENYDERNYRDFVDMYLTMEKKDETVAQSMMKSIFDLFGAGGKTTATTLHWAILFLIHHPDIQEKCRRHILEVVGSSRQPVQKDSADLIYVLAVIEETLRVGNTAPVAGFHCTQYEMRYKDYIIPADTMIYPSVYSMHMSEDEWGPDAAEFRPERWIGDDGKLKVSNAFMPFGAGPRECPGQTLSKQEMFIFLTTMLQHFRFHAVDPDNLPSLVGDLGIVLCPKDYKVIVSKV